MGTERLYYDDSYLTSFNARVVRRGEYTGKPAVVLDRSAFYPEGGGQPADQGTLSGVRVTDVQVDDAGDVWHVIDGVLQGDAVEGVIDWNRRYDHMQQHHGQHLLSAAFENLFSARTVSFHLGGGSVTIDLGIKELSREQLETAEALANKVIWDGLPVLARFVSAGELAGIRLRKAPTVEGPIRVVSAGDFDHSACGGTHPDSTGGVGMIHVRRTEKRGNETRVEFVCGGRALRDLRILAGLVGRVAGGLTVGADELEAAIGRLRESEDRGRKKVEDLVERLAGFEAERLVREARGTGTPVVRRSYPDRSITELKYLATAIAEQGGIALLGTAGEKAQLVCARPARSAIDCGKLLRETLAEFGGKGGGQPAMAQGGLPDPAKLEAALDAAARRVTS